VRVVRRGRNRRVRRGGTVSFRAAGRRALDEELTDRQDFFLDQLARRGIYANLSLHVGRAFAREEGFPPSTGSIRAFRHDGPTIPPSRWSRSPTKTASAATSPLWPDSCPIPAGLNSSGRWTPG